VIEADVAAPVVTYLEGIGCDVYQEVTLPRSGDIADIVATRGGELWVVETKTSWSLDLLEQCMSRRRYAHRVFAACPLKRGFRDRAALALELKIGSIAVRMDRHDSHLNHARGYQQAPLLEGILTSQLRASLSPQHKTRAPAGTNGGGRYTPFVATCEALRALVQQEPGITLSDAVSKITHHYSSRASAISSLAKWIERGKVPGVVWHRDTVASQGTTGLLLYPKAG
jgi:hypothetical protein